MRRGVPRWVGGWGDKFVHREFLLSIPSTYWLEVGVMGDLLGSPLFFNSFIITASNISHR